MIRCFSMYVHMSRSHPQKQRVHSHKQPSHSWAPDLWAHAARTNQVKQCGTTDTTLMFLLWQPQAQCPLTSEQAPSMPCSSTFVVPVFYLTHILCCHCRCVSADWLPLHRKTSVALDLLIKLKVVQWSNHCHVSTCPSSKFPQPPQRDQIQNSSGMFHVSTTKAKSESSIAILWL